MRIMLIGAGGFIGRHVMAELLAGGHDVVGVARSIGTLSAAFPQAECIAMDLAQATSAEAWRDHLAGIDIVINAAGILRGRDMDAVHVRMPEALQRAALAAGVKRVVLISAISARPDVATDYARSKLAGEAALRSSGIAWTVLRPSLVYGDGSYGGTSLMRGMAGLPWITPLPGSGDFRFTPIHVADLARAIRLVCEKPEYAGRTLEPVGPDMFDLRTLLAAYRAWLGFGRARFLSIPMPLMTLLGRIGDIAGDGPIASNSLIQMVAGNSGDSAAFAEAIGFVSRSLNEALRDRPAQVQDRWHARLFFLAPLLKAVLVLMWIASAALGLAYGAARTGAVLQGLGLPGGWAAPLRIGGSVLDIGIAALLILDRRARWATPVQLLVVAGYTLVIGIALPGLWLDPLGPLLKNLPILLAIAVHGAVADKR
ncbi:SDR family oxidoreductase [Sphingomonas sp. dw_22]|uniref:SDR family oxidoreductase n=1 Tax=Sphingomonas sp. dw_22 TaxID=2721175 RepID=UPI001BD411CE|nr:SDR family oxidoreductase [Sphingomonas sp. dw_22]